MTTAMKELEAHAKLAADYECGYTVIKSLGAWEAAFVVKDKERRITVKTFKSNTASGAFAWCTSHHKAVESLLPKEAV